MTVSVLWFLLAVPWDGLLCMIVVFPDHTHMLFFYKFRPTICIYLYLCDQHMFICLDLMLIGFYLADPINFQVSSPTCLQ